MPECIACSNRMVLRFGEKASNHWKCPKCALECISPQPDDLALAAIYDASYFAHYQAEIDLQIIRAMKRATYARQLRRMGLPQSHPGPKRLLDCGAATGFFAELAKELGWDAFAIEISEFGAKACEELLGPERVYRGQVQDASFRANPEGQFEIITMFDFIEHVREPRDVLGWAKQRLHPSGVLLMTTPRAGSASWCLMGRHWFHYTAREHLWFFSLDSMRILLERSGFTNINIRPLSKAVTVGYALAHYGRKTSHSNLFSPPCRALSSVLPAAIKRQRLWFYLGEMLVTARA